VRRGDLVTAYTSLSGRSWTVGATYNMSGFSASASLDIGLMATGAGAADAIPAHFSYLRVYRLNGAAEPTAGTS
jgi:hypothetical protein